MGWFSSATTWVKKKVITPAVTFVVDTTQTFVDKVGDVLEAGGNFISGLASTKFGTSGTVSGTDGNDLVVGLDFNSITNFLKLSFQTLFSAEFWSSGTLPSSLTGFADKNSNRLTLDGKGGDDTMFAFGGLPTIYGGSGNDKILSLGGDNRIWGDAGNDFIVAAGIVNRVYGGSGNDVAIVLGGANIVRGDGGNDTLTVFGLGNDIDGGDGTDVVVALGGANIVRGGAGDDKIFTALGANVVRGGMGNDLIAGAGLANILLGGGGRDTIIAIGAENVVYGDLDALDGGAGDNDANAGNDVIVSFGALNIIFGEGGDDVITAFGGGVVADGGAGNDVIVALAGGNVILGDDGDDLVVGLGAANGIFGGAGDDIVVSFGQLDLSFGGAGDDILVSVGAPFFAFQMGDAGQDIIVGVGGTVRAMFGDDPFGFVPGGDGDDDAKRDGIIGFAEQTFRDFQFTDFEFEDLSLPTLPSLDDLDAGALDAVTGFIEGAWNGIKGVYNQLTQVTVLFDPETYNTDRLVTAFTDIEFPGFSKPTFAGLGLTKIGDFSISSLSLGALDGFSTPATPDLSALDLATLDVDGIDSPLDRAFSANGLVVPSAGTGAIGLPALNGLLPDRSNGFDPGALSGVTKYFPGEDFSTAGLPNLGFSNLLDLPDFGLPDADGLLAELGGLTLPSGAALSALGQTFSGLTGRFESFGLFQPGEGRGSFNLPDVSLPSLSLPSFELYSPEDGDDSDILVSVAGASLLFGQEDDDLLIGAGLMNLQFGGAGSDILVALAKGNLLSGGQDDDVVVGVGILNLISGGEGSDILGSAGKFNVVAGGTDGDILVAGGLANLMLGGSGRDLIGGGGKLNILAGGADSDIILGGGKFNLALGGAGDDLMVALGTLNVMLGGVGGDLVLAGGKFNTILAGEGNDIAVGIGKFNVIDGDEGDDLLIGGGKFNLLYARAGNDALIGGGTFNTLIAGSGTDLLLGGGKFNTFMAGVEDDTDAQDHDIVFTAGRYNTFFAGAGDDLSFIGGELNTAFLGAGQDIAIAFASNLNLVMGQEGADIILGAGVGNLYSGGLDNDFMFGFGRSEDANQPDPGGGSGDGGTGTGTGGSGGGGGSNTNLDIRSDGTVQLNGDFGNDLMIAVGTNVFVEGGTGHDKVFAAGGLSFIEGNEGYDFLFSPIGLSALDGGDGNDVIYSKGSLAALGLPSISQLAFDGGDVQGGKGSDLIWTNGLDIEVFGDVGVSIFSPAEAPDGATRDESDGDDFIVVSGSRSEVYGQAGDDAIFLFGALHRADAGTGDDLIFARGDDIEVDGGAGNDEIVHLGGGIARSLGGDDDDTIIAKGYGLIDWMSQRGDAVWTELSNNFLLMVQNIGDLIGDSMATFSGFRNFDGSEITVNATYGGRDGLGVPLDEDEIAPDAVRQAEIDAYTNHIFTLIDEYGVENLGTALAEFSDPSVAPFAPSYDTLAGDVVQAATAIAGLLPTPPALSGLTGLLPISAFVQTAILNPVLSGGAGNDILAGRLGVSTLLGNEGDDVYRKAVGERITILDEDGGGGDDTLVLSAFATDLLSFGLDGLQLSDLVFERVDARDDGTANDLLITVQSTSGRVRSLAVILDQFTPGGEIETLILRDGLGGETTHDLLALSAAAGLNASTQIDGDELGGLVAADIDLLETELNASTAYQDLWGYDDFALDEGVQSDGGESFDDLRAEMDAYFGTLGQVAPGASTVGKGDISNTLDGSAYDGAPSVSIPEGGGQVLVDDGATLEIQRFVRDGLPRFDNTLTAAEGTAGFRSLHVLADGSVPVEAAVRSDIVIGADGIDAILSPAEVEAAWTEAGFGAGATQPGRSGIFAQLTLGTGDVTDFALPVQVRAAPYDLPGGGAGGATLLLDGADLGGAAVEAGGFDRLLLAGVVDLRALTNGAIVGDGGDQSVDVSGDVATVDLGGGNDTLRLLSGSTVALAGDGDDLIELSLQSGGAPRILSVQGGGGSDIFRILAPAGDGAFSGVFTLATDASDIVDLSQIGPDVTVAATAGGGLRLSNGAGSSELIFAGDLPRLLWTDGVLRQISDTGGVFPTEPVVRIFGETGDYVSPAGGTGDDLVFAGAGGNYQLSNGNDTIIATANSVFFNLGFGNDTVVTPLGPVNGTYSLFNGGYYEDFRFVQGFDVLAFVNDVTGDVNTLEGEVSRIIFRDTSFNLVEFFYNTLDIQTPTQSVVTDEDVPVSTVLDAPTGLPAGTMARIRFTEDVGRFYLGPLEQAAGDIVYLSNGQILDPSELARINFAPDANINGPDGLALFEIEYFNAYGPVDRRDLSYAVTSVDDPVTFGFDGQTPGAPLVLNEGDPLADLRLVFSDIDGDYLPASHTLRLQFDPGTTGAVLQTGSGPVTSFNASSVAELQQFLDTASIVADENANGTITLTVVTDTAIIGGPVFDDFVQQLVLTPVDDAETFTGVPAAPLMLPENSSSFFLGGLGIDSLDEEGGEYRVEFLVPVSTNGVGGYSLTASWPSIGGSQRQHSEGAILGGGVRFGDSDLVQHSLVGTLDQIQAAIGELFVFGYGNFEGEAEIELTLYKVTGDVATRDPLTLAVPDGEELQDSFVREIFFEKGQNAPVVDRFREIHVTADAGLIDLETLPHFDPDFSVDAQPDFQTNVNILPSHGELRLADGTPVEQFQILTDAQWASLQYYVDPDVGAIGTRTYLDAVGYIPSVVNPLYGITTSSAQHRIRVVDDKALVPDGAGGFIVQTVGASFINETYGDAISNSIFLGGDGDDYFEPRNGTDMMLGGGGADTFRIDENAGEYNVIGDFEPGVDTILFGALSVVEIIEEYAFLDVEGGIADDTLDTRLILSNGSELVLEGATNVIAFQNVAPGGLEASFDVAEHSWALRDTPPSVSGNVLVGAGDANGDAFSVDLALSTDVAHGTLDLQADGSFTYTPDRDFFGEDFFTYVLTDGIDTGRAVRVTLNVIDDPLNGGDDVDVIVASGIDGVVISGNDGDDVLTGTTGRDTFIGGAGDDVIELSPGGSWGNFDFVIGTMEELDGDTILDWGQRTIIRVTDALMPEITVVDDGEDRLMTFTDGDRTATIRLGGETTDFGTLNSVNARENLLPAGTDIFLSPSRTTVLFDGNDRFISAGAQPGSFEVYGNDGHDGLFGNDESNGLFGGADDDVLSGGDGNDYMWGGAGINILSGGPGQDSFIFKAGDFSAPTGDPDQQLEVQIVTDWSYAGGDSFQFYGFGPGTPQERGMQVLNIDGGTLVLPNGDHRAIFLQGVQATFDEVVGWTSFDLFFGLRTAQLWEDPTDLTTGSIRYVSQDDEGNDLSAGDLADLLYGGGGDDTLSGNGGDDTLGGGAGDDIIAGGAGINLLTGGEGNDVFLFRDVADPAQTRDTITDFRLGSDRIVLENLPGITTLDDVVRTTTSEGLELDIGGGRTILLPGFAATEVFGARDIQIATGEADWADFRTVETDLSALAAPVPGPGITVEAYSVPIGELVGALALKDFGLGVRLDTTVLVGLTDDDGVLTGTPDPSMEVFIGGDNQGPATGLNLLTLLDGTSGLEHRFLVIERAEVADYLLVPLSDDLSRTVTRDFDAGTLFVADAKEALPGAVALSNVVIGSVFDESLEGTELEDALFGLRGNDILSGGDGDDMLSGGEGDDMMIGGDGNDVIGGSAPVEGFMSLARLQMMGGADEFSFF